MENNKNNPFLKIPYDAKSVTKAKSASDNTSDLSNPFMSKPYSGIVKKKDASTSGDSTLTSNIPEESGASELDIQDISIESITQSLLDEFYGNFGEVPLNKKIQQYEKYVSEGYDPQEAADTLGINYNIVEKEDGKYVSPYLSDSDKQTFEQAKEYIKSKLPDEIDNRITKNIKYYQQQFENSQKTVEDYENFKSNIIPLLREKYKYTPIISNDISVDDIKKEFELSKSIVVDSWDEVKNVPSVATNIISKFGFDVFSSTSKLFPLLNLYAFKRDPNATEYSDDLIRARLKSRGSFSVFSIGKSLNDPEVRDLEYKHELVNISRDLYDTASGVLNKLEEGFFEGVAGGVKEYSSSFVDTIKSLTQRDSFKQFEQKIIQIGEGKMTVDDLNDEEFMLVHSMATTGAVIDKFKDKIPMSQEVGEAIGQSIGFILEMLMTSGVGAATSKAAGTQVLKLSAGRLTPTLSTKLSAQAAETLSKAAIQTAAMPSFVKGVAEKYGQGEDLGRSIIEAYGDTYTEVLSEKLFTTPATKIARGSAVSNFWARTNSAFGKVKDIKTLLESTVEEATEEYFSGMINGWREGNNVYDFSGVNKFLQDTRQQSVIWMSTGIMALGGGAVNKMSQIKNERKYKRLGQSLQGLKDDIDVVLQQPELSVTEVVNAIDDIIIEDAKASRENNFDNIIEKRAVALQYAQSHFVKEAHDGISRGQMTANAIVNGERDISSTEEVVARATEQQQEVQEPVEDTKQSEVLRSGDGYKIELYEGEKTPVITFEGDLNASLDRMVIGESVTKEELDNIVSKLSGIKKFVKNKKTVSALNSLLEQAKDLRKDLKPVEEIKKEIKDKITIKVSGRENLVVVNKNASSSRVYDVYKGDFKVGMVQEDVVDGKSKYTVVNGLLDTVGEFDSMDAVGKALQELDVSYEIAENVGKPIQKNKVADSQTLNAIVSEDKEIGFVQKDVIGDREAFIAFDGNKKKINDFSFETDALKAIVDNYKKNSKKTTRITRPKVLGYQSKILEIDEMSGLRTRIQAEQKAAKEGFLEHKKLMQDIAEGLKKAKRNGKLSSTQVTAITSRMAKTNLSNPAMREKFLAYADKVFEKAENIEKIKRADNYKNRIRRSKKDPNRKKNATLKKYADDFLKLDPRFAENIDDFLEVAESIRQGLSAKTVTGENVKNIKPPQYDEIRKYIDKETERQDKIKAAMKSEMMLDVGLEEGMTEEEIQALNDKKQEEIKKQLQILLKNAKNNANFIIDNGVDEYGSPVNLTEKQKSIISEFINLDINKFPIKEVGAIIDALNNFIVNQNTDGMAAAINIYKGELNAEETKKRMRGFKFFYPMFGQTWIGKQIASFPILLENVFRGRSNAAFFMDKSGFTDYVSQKTKASGEALKVAADYLKFIEGKKPNGKRFNDLDNIVERGMYAFMIRQSEDIDSEEDFKIKKDKILQSAQALMSGSKRHVNMGKAYTRVYQKMFKDAKSIEDLNVNKYNKEAVDWWINKWGEYYDELKEVSENVYNKKLARDNNYTPLNVSAIDFDSLKEKEVKIGESAFHHSAENIFDKESHVLIDAKKYTKLPHNRFINFDFEANMTSILRSALIDMYTAESVKNMQGFFGSKHFRDMFEDPQTAKVVFERVQGIVADSRGKSPITNKDFMEVKRTLGKLANFASAKTLGSLMQPVKQTAPVMANTIINAGHLDFGVLTDKAQMAFIDRSGQPISLRGAEALGSVVDMDELGQLGYLSGEQTQRVGQKLNNFLLNKLLVAPDVYIARMSWMTYYKNRLKKLGYDVDKINWETHKVNKEAAEYAQAMVDRQQNISDASLLGEFLKSKDPLQTIIRNVLFPFSNFMFNQKMRIWTDIATIKSSASSYEDKIMASRSLAGAIVEQSMFHVLSYYIRQLTWNTVLNVLGTSESDDKERERLERTKKMYVGYFLNDLISPFPVVDDIVLMAVSSLGVELPDFIAPRMFTTYGDVWGTYGIGWDKTREILPLIDMATDGKFGTTFLNRKTIHYLNDEQTKIARDMAGIYALYLSGLLPAEFGTMARDAQRILKSQSVTETSLKKYEDKEGRVYKGRQ